MKKGDICEVVGVPPGKNRFYADGARCEIITPGCDTPFVMFSNGCCISVPMQNLRPISEFHRGDRVLCGDFEDAQDLPGEYYDNDNKGEYQHLVRMDNGIVKAWRYCKKAEPEIKKDTKVLVRQHESHQWDRKYATGKFIDGSIQCYSNGADSWSGGNSFCTCWKYWKLADEND